MGSISCFNLNTFGSTEGEKMLLDWYKDDESNPLSLKALLAATLHIWREYNCLTANDYPETKEELTEFYYQHGTAESDARGNNDYDISDEQWEDLNDVNNGNVTWLGTSVLENRLRMIASMFSEKIDNYQSTHRSLSRSECIYSMGGTKRMVRSIIGELAKLDDEGIVKKFGLKFENKTYDELSDAQKDEVQKIHAKIKALDEHKDSISILCRRFLNEYETDVQFNVYSREDNPDIVEDSITELKGKRYLDHRTLDIGETITSRAKNILSKLYLKDVNGNVVYDDIGFPVKVSTREALQTLVQFCYTSTQETFMDDLNTIAGTYPWVQSLIDEIKGSKVKKGAIFSASKKAKMLYSYILLDRGYYQDKRLNTMAAHNAVLRTISKNFGNHILNSELTLYDEANGWADKAKPTERANKAGERWDKFVASRERLIGSGGTISSDVFYVDTTKSNPDWRPNHQTLEYNGESNTYYVRPRPNQTGVAGIEAMQWYLDRHTNELEMLSKFAAGFGLQLSASEIRKAALTPLTEKDKKFFSRPFNNRYQIIAECIGGLYISLSGYDTIEKALIDNSTTMHDLMLAIGISKYDDVDSKGNDEGKIRQTYITPNLITQVWSELRNDRKEDKEVYLQKLQDKYLKYEGFTLNGKPTGLLKFLYEHPERADKFILGDESSFNHVTYDKMTKQQVGSMQYTIWRGNHYEPSKFIVPVSADYSICYTLQIPRGVVPSGRLVAERDSSGRPVKFNTDTSIVNYLTEEVLCEYNRIQAIKDRKAKGDRSRSLLKTYEGDSEHLGMGEQFNIFPEMNTSGFAERLGAEPNAVKRLEMLKEEVARLLYENVIKDWNLYEQEGIFTSLEFKDKVRTKDGKVVRILDPFFEEEFERFSEQTFYVRQQLSKIMFGDLGHFKNLLDFEKRAMMQHSPATPIFFDSMSSTQNVMYIKDVQEDSLYEKDFKEMLSSLAGKKLIPSEKVSGYTSSYNGINATDGQGFRTLPSWKKIQEGLGKWTDRQERAYNKIMNTDAPILKSDIDALGITGLKLAYRGYQEIAAEPTGTPGIEQKPVRTPVFHKYSEQVLLPYHRLKGLVTEAENVPVMALSKFAYGMLEASKSNPSIKAPELLLFESGCKVGGHDICDPWHDESGNVLTSSGQIVGKLLSYVRSADGVYDTSHNVQTLDMQYLGESATLDTATEDTEIHITSQAEKIMHGNTSPGDMIDAPGMGKMSAVDGRRLYDEISTTIIAETWQGLCKELGNYKAARRILMQEMSKMSYVSEETKLALTRVKDIGTEFPLFSPQVQHEAQSIILSIIRNRMQKHKAPGARFVQRSSLGWDETATAYSDPQSALKKSDKLSIKFDGEGDNKRIAYVEAYIPLTDHRLKPFANANGEITAERLNELVAEGVIPEEMLYCVGYRTPSDAEHSILPIKIKGFLSPASGNSIILPREIMTMTGHDYDGDEMPVHFHNFKAVVDLERAQEYYDELNKNGEAEGDFSKFVKSIEKGLTPSTARFYKFETYKYDTSLSPIEQASDGTARRQNRERMNILDNARLNLLFGQVSSSAYTQRMLIPGGAEDTKCNIKAIQLLRMAANLPSEQKGMLLRTLTTKLGIAYTDDYGTLFMRMRGLEGNKALSSKDIETLLNEYQPKESPFSARHTIDSYGYMIEAANMIGVFAKYMSSFQMLQKADVRYLPYVSKDSKNPDIEIPRETVLFGKEFNNQRMFEIRDITGKNMLSRVMSRLINAAVDNGKDPLLGILNIGTEVAPLMVTMCGLGMTEDQIDLLISQPAVVAALKKTSVDRISFSEAISAVIADMDKAVAANQKEASELKISYDRAAKELLSVPESAYADEIVKDFDTMLSPKVSENDFDISIPDYEGLKFQKMIMLQVRQIHNAAEDLEEFISSLLRPESSSGGTSSTIGKTHRRIVRAEECKARIDAGKFRIGGLKGIVRDIEFRDGISSKELVEQAMQSEVPQYTLMRSLEVDGSMFFMRRWFPQARDSWQAVAKTIALKYGLKNIKDNLIDSIYKDMILWKILQNPAYSSGADASEMQANFRTLQDHMLDKLPAALNRLQGRVLAYKSLISRKNDAIAMLEAADRGEIKLTANKRSQLEALSKFRVNEQLELLSQNSFLMNLKVYHQHFTDLKPRIQFRSGGIDMSKLSDQVRRDWTSMFSEFYDEDIRQIAADLVDYSLFVNGFGFGTYEFGHLASTEAMRLANGGRMLNALQDILDSDFIDEEEITRFTEQYIQNHWKDKGLLRRLSLSKLVGRLAPDGTNPSENIKGAIKESDLKEGTFYIIDGGKNGISLVKYLGKSSPVPFKTYNTLGTINNYKQRTVEYNPYVNAEDMVPYQLNNDSSFVENAVSPFAESSISDEPDRERIPDSVYRDDLNLQDEMKITREDRFKARLFGTDPRDEAKARIEKERKDAEASSSEKVPAQATTPSVPQGPESFAAESAQESRTEDVNPADINPEDLLKNAEQNGKGGINLFEGKFFSITRMTTNENGERVPVTERVPATPEGVALARKRDAYLALNKKLRSILETAGVGIGRLTTEELVAYAEEELALNGVADFDTAKVFANGLIELIRLRDGQPGEEALPEEFSHVAIEMLGADSHPLVKRLFDALRNDSEGMQEAFDGEYELYRNAYSQKEGDWESRLVEEAAGKLLAKKLLWRQEIATSKFRSLIQRIVDAFHDLLRKIPIKALREAIIDADTEASLLARDLLGGRLLDEMNLKKIKSSSKFLSAARDITDAKGTIEKLIKIETKSADIIERRLGHNKSALGSSVEYAAATANLGALNLALKNHKTEDAVLGYMESALQSLTRAENYIDECINKGEPANVICKQLTLLRDTLFSQVQALDAIREGLDSGEITDSGSVKKNVDSLAGVIQDFFDKYKRLSKEYMKKGLLERVYGPNGLDITVGKDRGKHVSIEDMATTGEEYTGIQISALVDSMADQKDYVLKAFDSVVREAKFKARKRQSKYAERIAVAVSKLHSATGSLDQTFLFARNEKGHKTGKFITEEQAASLTKAQKEYFYEIMAIKHEIDTFLPEHRVRKNGIICVRKGMFQKIGEAKGLKAKLITAKNSIEQAMTSYAEEEYDTEKVYVDFEGNKVDMLPIKFINKGKRESYDDMTDDVASALMAYAGMATEYNEMQGVINILENAKFASMERNIVPKKGNRTPVETIENEQFSFTQPFTVKQAHTVIQKCLADFMSMHVYGHLHKTTGYITLFGRKIPLGKLVDVVNSVTSYSQMALNPMQRISNVTTGFAQIAIQTAGRDYFGASDVMWASGIYLKESPDRIAETGADESHNKLSLFNERFDIGQRYNNESNTKKYGKSRASKIFNTHVLYMGLEIGEDYLASTTGLAIAKNTKVLLNGKEINLYDAYDVAYTDEKGKNGAYLKLKDGVTKLDGSAFTQNDELEFSKKCASVNFRLQGIYNTDDRAAIQQYPLGSLVIMYRKWIAPSIKRRYNGMFTGKAEYNELTGSEDIGYHTTSFYLAGNILKNIVKDGEGIRNSIAVNWNNLTAYEKANCKKSATEFGILAGIALCLSLLDNLPPDDDDDEKTLTWRDNMVIYQVLRLRNELGSQAPTTMFVQEATKILSSPMACIRLFDNAFKGLKLLNPLNYIGEDSIIGEDAIIKSGRFKGHTKAYKYFWSLPILSMRKSVENVIDPEPLINYYK